MKLPRRTHLRSGAAIATTLLVAAATSLAAGGGNGTGRGIPATTCAGKPADIIGTTGDDSGAGALIGTSERDVILALEGEDEIDGGAGNDIICARSGDDQASGGDDDDVVRGGRGNDFIFGNDGEDELRGGRGNDEIFGDDDDDLLSGGPGNDGCNGGPGTDEILPSCEGEANRLPVAEPDTDTTSEDAAKAIDVLANDSDPDGDDLEVGSLDTTGTQGEVTITGGGSGVSFDPDGQFESLGAGDTDSDSFSYTASDGKGGTDTATVHVTITGVEDNPSAQPDSATVAEDATATTIDVQANDDADPEGDATTITSTTDPANGTVAITNAGADLTYEPDDDYCNDPGAAPADTFDYTLTPGGSSATVSVTVTCEDDAPVAVDDTPTVGEDAAATTIDVRSNDTDPDGAFTIQSVTQPPNGDVQITNGGDDLTYQPDANYCNDGSPTDDFTYTLTPGGDEGAVAVTVNCSNDPPEVDLNGAGSGIDTSAAFTEDSGPATLAPDATVADVDDSSLASAEVKLAATPDDAAESLDADTSGTSITAAYSSATGTLTLSGTDTLANYQQVLRNAAYENTDDTPTVTDRSIAFTVNDGDDDSATATATLSVTAANDAPTLDLNGVGGGIDTTATFNEPGPAVDLATATTVSDPDDASLASAEVELTNAQDGAAESLTVDLSGTSITLAGSSTAQKLVLTGADTLASYQQVLRTVDYNNTATPPDATPDRTVEFIVNDGDDDSAVATATVNVVPLNEAPEVDLNGVGAGIDTSTGFTEGGGPATLASGALVTDVDDTNLTSATITLTNRPDGNAAESLAATVAGTSITAGYTAATGVLALTGSDTLANYQQVIRSITYQNTDDDPTTTDRSITFVVNDGQDDSATATATVSVTPTNDAPGVDLNGSATGTGTTATFTEDGGAISLAPATTVTDPDDVNLESAQIRLTNRPDGALEAIAVSTAGTSITAAAYDSGTGILALSGTDALANYQQVLATASYANTDQDPDSAARIIEFKVNDGSADSNVPVATVTVTPVNDPPAADMNGAGAGIDSTAAFTEDSSPANPGSGPATVGPNALVSDVDDANLNSATITLTNRPDGAAESLGATTGGTSITANYTPGTGVLALTGSDSKANYQQVLRTVAYNNTSNTPTTTDRAITTVVNDGDANSPTANTTVTVTATNDPPIADNESFSGTDSAVGNTTLVVNDPTDGAPSQADPKKSITGDILAGDTDPDGPSALTVGPTGTQAITTQDGGKVTLEADGDFTFFPKAATSCTDASDQFDYTVADGGANGTDTGTVTIAIAECVWYVDNALASNGNGSSASPFNTLGVTSGVGLNGPGGTGDSDDADDYLFLYQGSGSYTGGLPLENNQRLFSQRHGLTVGSATLFAAAGNNASIANAGGNAVTLASGNNVQGLDLGTTPAASASLTGNTIGTASVNNTTSGAISNSTGGALNVSGGTLTAAFTDLDSSGATNDGIRLDNLAGSFSAGSGSSLQNAGGQDVDISGDGSGDSIAFTYDGTIADASGTVVNVSGQSGGTKDFNGTIGTSASPAGPISLSSNTGATVRFDGGTILSTGASAAFSATGGGTVAVTDPNTLGTEPDNRLTTTTGTALNVANTAIGSDDLNFRSISANGGANGITLNSTGTGATNGGLTVTGSGTTAGSGGTIQSTTGRGASFVSARDISLKNMNFTNASTSDLDATNGGLSTGDNLDTNASVHLQTVTNATLDRLAISGGAEQGINGNAVSNFVLSNSSITDAGNEADEDGIHFFNMTGTSSISATNITSTVATPNTTGGDDHLNLQTQSGTLDLTISGGSVTNANKGSGYLFGIRGTSNATLTLQNTSTTGNFSGGIVADVFNDATMDLSVTGTTSSGNNDQLSVSAGDNSNVDLTASGNTLESPSVGDFVVVGLLGSAFDDGFTFDATIQNNTIDVGNDRTADGIIINNAGGGDINALVTGNTIDYGGSQRAIAAQSGSDGNGSTNLTITDNDIDIELDGTLNGQGILANTAITGPGNTSAMCADIGGAGALANTFTHSLGGAIAAGDIRVRQRNDGTMRLPGYAGSATDLAAVVSFLNGRNTEVSTSTATADSTGFAGGAACTQPSP